MKKVLSYFVVLSMLVLTLVVPTDQFLAYEAKLAVEVSSSTVMIGDVVTVTVKVPGDASGPVSLYFPTELFECVEKSKNMNQVGGTIQISIGTGGLEKSNSASVKLKAKTSGVAELKVEATGDIYDDGTYEEVVLKSATTSVSIENKAVEPETPKSDDNSLASLKLSSGSLSPSFQYSVTSYTATVEYDVEKVVVSATTSNANAVIESVTGDGNVSLNVGENTIQVVVRAENGVKATYTVVVTRKAYETPDEPDPSESEETENTETEEPGTDVNSALNWNGEQLYTTDSIPSEKIPSGFESKLMVVNGEQMNGLSFKNGELTVLYLNNTNGAGSLYVYDAAKKEVYPFVKLTSDYSYVMVLRPDETNDVIPEGYEKCALSIEGKGSVTAFQKKEATTETTSKWNLFGAETFYAAPAKESDFYLIYCMNQSGEMGWYMYDTVEKTFMRYLESTPSAPVVGDVPDDSDLQNKYAALLIELNAAKMTQYIIIAIAAAVVIILIIVILVLALKKRGTEEIVLEEYEMYDEGTGAVEAEYFVQKQEEVAVVETSEEAAPVEADVKEEKNKKDEESDLEFIDFE